MNNIIVSELYEIIESKENVDAYLNNILDVFDLIKKREFYLFKNDDIWNYRVGEVDFVDWLYSKNAPELVDLKTELSIHINKAHPIDKEFYDKYTSYLEEKSPNFHDFSNQFVFLSDDSKEKYHNVSTLNKYYNVLRWYLKKCPNINILYNSGNNLFPNLYFHENVLSSLRTLNNSFSSIKEEIIEHLKALDSYSGNGNKKLGIQNKVRCQKISEEFMIECSPEANRKTAKKMSFEIDDSRGKRNINCEYHTKFKKFGKDTTKQDRIYFSFGDKDFQNGKMIIYHIGDHV